MPDDSKESFIILQTYSFQVIDNFCYHPSLKDQLKDYFYVNVRIYVCVWVGFN